MSNRIRSINPFPGLRPFSQDEDYLFFGREEQTIHLLQRLGGNRFVAVVGASGSGKSSLVRCGLLSELLGGKMLQAEVDLGLWLMQQMKALGLTLSLDGTDIELRAIKHFIDGSLLTELFSDEPRELELIGQMPANSFLVTGAAYSSNYWQQVNSAIMMGFVNSLEIENKAEVQQQVKDILRVMEKLTKNMGDELAGAARFGEALFPDIIGVYEAKDSRWMMDETLKMVPEIMALYQHLGLPQMAEMAEKMKPTVVETYLGTEILNMEMPTADMMGQVPEEARGMMPESWNMWYAPTDDHLVYAMSSGTDAIKEQIDALSGAGGTFAQWLEDTDLAEKAPKENNWIVFLSPIAGLKSAINIISETEPNIGMMGMFLENVPSKFSIIASGSNLPGGHEFRLQISAGDFRELVGIAVMMGSM